MSNEESTATHENTKADQARHTPTPWCVQEWEIHAPTSITIERDGRTYQIAECSGFGEYSDVGVANAAFIVRAANSHDALVSELAKANQIILNALNLMTNEQKRTWGILNACKGVDGAGITRFDERSAVLASAKGVQ